MKVEAERGEQTERDPRRDLDLELGLFTLERGRISPFVPPYQPPNWHKKNSLTIIYPPWSFKLSSQQDTMSLVAHSHLGILKNVKYFSH